MEAAKFIGATITKHSGAYEIDLQPVPYIVWLSKCASAGDLFEAAPELASMCVIDVRGGDDALKHYIKCGSQRRQCVKPEYIDNLPISVQNDIFNWLIEIHVFMGDEEKKS